MYARNNASPRPITIGAVVQISDGAVQTTGVSVKVRKDAGSWATGAGTLAVEEGIWSYTPTQSETDCEALQIVIFKTSCIPNSMEVVTTSSSSFGHAGTDQSKIANASATQNLSGTSIKTATDVETKIDAIDDYIDTEVAAIKAKTDNLPANPAAVGDIPTAGAIADAVLEESVDDHDGVAQSLAKYISIIKKGNTVVDGTVTSAATPTTTSFSSDVNYPTGAFKHAVLLFLDGNLSEQNSPILTYTNTNGIITVEEAFTQAPQTGDNFIIIPTTHVHAVSAIQNGLALEASSQSILARIGAFTGTGVNTILGFFRALLRSDGGITTPSDVGGTFTHTTDSTQAIRDRGDAAWTTGGGGGGSTTVNVLPYTGAVPDRVEGTTIKVFYNELTNVSVGVTDATGAAVALDAKTLRFCVEDRYGADVLTLNDGDITRSGSTFTVQIPQSLTDTVGANYRWSLRDLTSSLNTVLIHGQMIVAEAAEDEA